MKKIKLKKNQLIFIIACIVLVICGIAGLFFHFITNSGNGAMSKEVFTAMDTNVVIKTNGEMNSEYKEKILELHNLLDFYNKNSEIYKLNENKTATLSRETKDVILKAKELELLYPECDITCGGLIDLWDITGEPKVPSEEEIKQVLSEIGINNLTVKGSLATLSKGKINLGCCAKGYACDILKEMFDENNESFAIVSFGSSSLLYGEKPYGKKFKVAIKNPLDTDEEMGVIKTRQCFVSTSGGYERYFEADGKMYSHIFNLKTGYPVESDLLSVTVIGDSGIESDFVSTCIYINGVAGLEYYLNLEKFKVIAIDKDKNVYISNSLKNDFEITDDSFSFAE